MRFVKILALATLVLVAPRVAAAAPITGDGSLGDFIGSFDYDPTGRVIVSLTNTSAAANGGYITALAFNNPNDVITGVTLSSTDTDFSLLGMPDFTNEFGVSPFGSSDIGASVSNQWLGGGSPVNGIAVGQTATFTFNLTGNLAALTTASFMNTFSTSGSEWLLVRFRGFNDGGSDKVPGTSVPEPTTIVLLASGLAMIAARQKMRRG
jgi:hypothetical protein